jgi:hypothetical protein
MQRQTKAELQMLREFGWLLLPRIPCHFCRQPLITRIPMTFGHRRHPPVTANLTVHHDDRNRENNETDNLKPCHAVCHRQYHANLRRTHEHEPADE